ncbi:hypothetical protein D3C80_1812600 [compost metagenome]
MFRYNNKLRSVLLKIVGAAGPDNCDADIIDMLNEALGLTENTGEEKAPMRGLCSSYQLGAPGALHHPGG